MLIVADEVFTYEKWSLPEKLRRGLVEGKVVVPRRTLHPAPSKLVFSFRSVVSEDASRKAVILNALEPMS